MIYASPGSRLGWQQWPNPGSGLDQPIYSIPGMQYAIYQCFFLFTQIGHSVVNIVKEIENGQWTPPEFATFTDEYTDANPYFSHDGRYFFFTRADVIIWNGDVYWVDAKIIEDLKPEELK